jgi:predicted amidohydrolase
MFTSGFTMNAEVVAETMQGTTVKWMKNLALKYNIAITGSVVIKENNLFHNRLLFVHPNGKIDAYNKRHTFTLAGEDKVYQSGTKKVIINYKDWKICPQICYDLRFPVWSRNTENYDLIFYVANWPVKRINAWDTLLKARAIENMAYCIGVNRVGVDGLGYEYSGNSAVYDALGKRLDDTPKHKEAISVVTLNKLTSTGYRERLGFLKDRDRFNLKS